MPLLEFKLNGILSMIIGFGLLRLIIPISRILAPSLPSLVPVCYSFLLVSRPCSPYLLSADPLSRWLSLMCCAHIMRSSSVSVCVEVRVYKLCCLCDNLIIISTRTQAKHGKWQHKNKYIFFI